jgi:hypothetical protein
VEAVTLVAAAVNVEAVTVVAAAQSCSATPGYDKWNAGRFEIHVLQSSSSHRTLSTEDCSMDI